MDCLVRRETLDDFDDNYIILSLNNQQPALFLRCVQRCSEIISAYKGAFPEDCAQLDLLIRLSEHNFISIKNCLLLVRKVVKDMYNHFDEKYKAPKIFISHSEKDKPIIEKFVTMLEQMGVKQNQLFCSSVAGYGIPQGSRDIYNFIRNEMSNDNLFFIMMLSQNYYKSPACLNEMGAAWIKQSEYQSILLPGFQYAEIEGAVNPRDMTFQLDDEEKRNYALNDFKERIVRHLGMDDIPQNLWERFRNKFIEEVDFMSKNITLSQGSV